MITIRPVLTLEIEPLDGMPDHNEKILIVVKISANKYVGQRPAVNERIMINISPIDSMAPGSRIP
jgi:hypothetical protein